VSKLG